MANFFRRLFHTQKYLEAEEAAEQRNCELMHQLESLNESTKALRRRLDEVEVTVISKATSDDDRAV